MNSLLDWFTNYCISNTLISKDNEAWFRYGLEKRLCTLVVLIPFAVIAIYLSGLWTAISYIVSFFYLRSQTNGYHAKTHWGCFVVSLLLELFFLMVIEPMLNVIWVLVLVGLAALVVFLLAPYNHPMMNLDDQEYTACMKTARIRCILLVISCYTCVFFGLHEIAEGISLGCVMTSTLLILAKITERRSLDDSVENRSKQRTSFVLQKND